MQRAQDRARSALFKNSGARSATIESRDENVPAKRADLLHLHSHHI